MFLLASTPEAPFGDWQVSILLWYWWRNGTFFFHPHLFHSTSASCFVRPIRLYNSTDRQQWHRKVILLALYCVINCRLFLHYARPLFAQLQTCVNALSRTCLFLIDANNKPGECDGRRDYIVAAEGVCVCKMLPISGCFHRLHSVQR